jgi:hypothetical protein
MHGWFYTRAFVLFMSIFNTTFEVITCMDTMYRLTGEGL